MRYEVYGVYNVNGVNDLIGVRKSMKAALKLGQDLPTRYHFYAVLVKSRKHSYPFEIVSGRAGLPATMATMLVDPNKHGNPLQNQEDGLRYWKRFDKGLIAPKISVDKKTESAEN